MIQLNSRIRFSLKLSGAEPEKLYHICAKVFCSNLFKQKCKETTDVKYIVWDTTDAKDSLIDMDTG